MDSDHSDQHKAPLQVSVVGKKENVYEKLICLMSDRSTIVVIALFLRLLGSGVVADISSLYRSEACVKSALSVSLACHVLKGIRCSHCAPMTNMPCTYCLPPIHEIYLFETKL